MRSDVAATLAVGTVLVLLAAVGSRAPQGPPARADVSRMTFEGLHVRPDGVTLRDGAWEGAPVVAGGASRPRVLLLPGFEGRGDVDADAPRTRKASAYLAQAELDRRPK